MSLETKPELTRARRMIDGGYVINLKSMIDKVMPCAADMRVQQ